MVAINGLGLLVQRFIPKPILKILTIITNVLVGARNATGGAFSKLGPDLGDGGINTPRFLVGNTPAPQGFTSPIKAAKDKIKEKIVEAGIKNIQKRIDTPEERQTIIDGIHVPGLPKSFTWVLSALGAIAVALMDAASHADTSLLILGEYRAWVLGVVQTVDWGNLWQAASTFIGLKIAFWTKQDSHNSTAVIKTEVVKGIAAATEAPEGV